MDLGIIIAIVGSSMAVVGVVLALFLWNRGEANSDRRDIVNLIVAIKEDVQAIQMEMKDFHAILCSIEERFRSEIKLLVSETKGK